MGASRCGGGRAAAGEIGVGEEREQGEVCTERCVCKRRGGGSTTHLHVRNALPCHRPLERRLGHCAEDELVFKGKRRQRRGPVSMKKGKRCKSLLLRPKGCTTCRRRTYRKPQYSIGSCEVRRCRWWQDRRRSRTRGASSGSGERGKTAGPEGVRRQVIKRTRRPAAHTWWAC